MVYYSIKDVNCAKRRNFFFKCLKWTMVYHLITSNTFYEGKKRNSQFLNKNPVRFQPFFFKNGLPFDNEKMLIKKLLFDYL